MAGVVFGVFCIVSVLCVAATGNMEAIGAACGGNGIAAAALSLGVSAVLYGI